MVSVCSKIRSLLLNYVILSSMKYDELLVLALQ